MSINSKLMLLILTSKRIAGPKMSQFLALISKEFLESKTSFEAESFEDTEVFLDKGSVTILIGGKPLTTWNTIYPRKVARHGALAFMIAHEARVRGIQLIDRFHEQIKDSSDISKITQMFRLASAGVSIPKTYFSGEYSEGHLEKAAAYLRFPIVIKECNTSQGAGVFLAKDFASLKAVITERSVQEQAKVIFLQEFIPNTFEYRLLVTGEKIAVAEKKIRSKSEEFRNNVHLGAEEVFIALSEVKESTQWEALQAALTTDIQVAGVDVVERENGDAVIFEVNSCPAFTLDQSISPEIKKLAEYLISCEKR